MRGVLSVEEEVLLMASRARVLITGGSGFIGACLARDLIACGQDVHLVLRQQSNLWRLAGIAGQYTTHWADLRDLEALKNAVNACRPQMIFHLATHGAYYSQQDRAAILATNLLGTANLLDALEGHEYEAFVHTGSSSEYGHKAGRMFEDDRLEPRTDYAVSKAAASLLCQAEAHKGRPISIVRVFSAYGPWEEPSRLVPYVMASCYRGESPQVTSGWQPRDFIHVDDVLRLLKLVAVDPKSRGQIFHAGTGRQHTVREMVEMIIDVCGNGKISAQFGAEQLRPGEPTSWVASIEQTTARTGWKPLHDLRSGVRSTWEWYTREAARKAA
jgi:nucleoside-diphosphate-sugar epimerase